MLSKLTTAAFALTCITMLTACQKEKSTDSSVISGKIQGTYQFVSIEANTESIRQVSAGHLTEKTVTLAHYISRDNKGRVDFSVSNLSCQGVAYTINTTTKNYSYQNGTVVDSIEMDMNFTLPPSTSIVPYTIVGSDSIHFASGTLMFGGIASAQPMVASGAKLRFDGKKLYLTSRIQHTETSVFQGVPVQSTRKADVVMTLQKQ